MEKIIIEVGSTNTKVDLYNGKEIEHLETVTIEFKKNYKLENKINEEDLNKLFDVIKNTLEYTSNIHIYGCSIFRSITNDELEKINANRH